jgi:glutathione synthase/RimK-type ligase-like ATP-grasp enzyme
MTPLTVCDVSWEELPSWVNRMGGVCVIKIPYSNAGQGVYTITSPHEFQAFQHAEQVGHPLETA